MSLQPIAKRVIHKRKGQRIKQETYGTDIEYLHDPNLYSVEDTSGTSSAPGLMFNYIRSSDKNSK